MIVSLRITPGTKIEPVEVDGQLVGFDITPYFPSQRGTAVLVYGKATNARGEELHNFLLAASGNNGKINCRSRLDSAKPFVDLTPAERAKLSEQAAEAKPDEEEAEEEDEGEEEEEVTQPEEPADARVSRKRS
jgi:hypothetical protein